MVLKVGNLDKWALLSENSDLLLRGRGTKSREVWLEVNTDTDTRVTAQADGVDVLLGVVCGLETFVFNVVGDCRVHFDTEGGVFYYTADGSEVATEIAGAASFIKPFHRQQRNPALEQVLRKLKRNNERLMAGMSATFAAELAKATAKKPDEKGGDEVRAGTDGGDTRAPKGTGDSAPKPKPKAKGQAPANPSEPPEGEADDGQ